MNTYKLPSRHTIVVYNDNNSDEITYIHTSSSEAEKIYDLLPSPKPALVAIDGNDWERDFSPWAAKNVFHGADDFTGGAGEYIKKLTDEIIPETDSLLGFTPRSRAIAGYSLAGLFAVYSMYKTDIFTAFASVSGSLWFDCFLAFAEENNIMRVPEKAYFSIGDREKNAKNPRMKTVEGNTKALSEIFTSTGAKTFFELNSGGHFSETASRMAKGIAFISCK